MVTNDYETVTLPRTGKTPLTFNGRNILSGATFKPDELDRGFTITLYQTIQQSLVAHVQYQTKWKSEAPGDDVYAVQEPGSLATLLLQHNPLEHFKGYPPAPQFEKKQERLKATLVQQYNSLVGRILTGLPGAAELG